MTTATQLRTSVAVLMVSAVAFVAVASQVLTSMIVKAVSDSKAVRVAPSTSCAVTEGGAHFTGCSTIL